MCLMGLPRSLGLTWEKDGHRFICKAETCNTSYSAKYLLVKNLQWKHDISIELGNPNTHLPDKKDHVNKTMHQWMHGFLNNPFLRFWHNEHKAITWAKAHATCKWDQLQNDALQIKLTLKPTLVRLASFYVDYSFRHSCMGCGVHAPQCDDQAKKGQWSCLFNLS